MDEFVMPKPYVGEVVLFRNSPTDIVARSATVEKIGDETIQACIVAGKLTENARHKDDPKLGKLHGDLFCWEFTEGGLLMRKLDAMFQDKKAG